MTEHNAESTEHVIDQVDERLRQGQERETFDQHKNHENRWFILRSVMGYTAVGLLLSIFGICVWVFLNHAELPPAVVNAASAGFFADVVGLVIAVWKIVLNPGFMTKLTPVTQSVLTTAIPKSTPDKSTEHKVETKEVAILSAKYGKGENVNDVTGIVKAIVTAAATGHVRFTVNNDTLGGDPLKGEVKELNLGYSYAGETRTVTIREREELSLP